jgi:flagellar biosynthesis/type III secretory pathway protein FliH
LTGAVHTQQPYSRTIIAHDDICTAIFKKFLNSARKSISSIPLPQRKFTQDIAAEVERVKQHNETRVEYMTLMMELKQQRREGYAEGEASGITKGQDSERLNSIRNLMESLHLTAQQAMDALKIPAKDQPKYASQI